VTQYCKHFEPDIRVDAPLRVCSKCDEMGGTWVHLRQCLTCGLTSCCDRSPNRHATAHFRATAHPMIRSAERDEDWQWCYEDDRFYEHGARIDEDATI
jgi:uncharacterized UBP type Zn finger protein